MNKQTQKQIIEQSMSGSLMLQTKNDIYYIEYICDQYAESQIHKGFNVRTKSGIDHYAHGSILYSTFAEAYGIVAKSIAEEKYNF